MNPVELFERTGFTRCQDKQGCTVFEAYTPGEFIFISKSGVIRIGRSLSRSAKAPPELTKRLTAELRRNERRSTVVLLPFAVHGDPERLDAVRLFMQMALDDGWELSNAYDLEPMHHACNMRRDGFLIFGLARPGLTKKEFNVQIAEVTAMPPGPARFERELMLKPKCMAELLCWGSDGLTINVPIEYPGMDYFHRAMKHCVHCRRTGVKTERVFQAGRACGKCAHRIRRMMEARNGHKEEAPDGDTTEQHQQEVVRAASGKVPFYVPDLDYVAPPG